MDGKIDSEQRIKALLRSRKLTYADVGARIGVSAQAICEIVKGRTHGPTARYALAQALGLKVTDIWPDRAA